MILAVTGHRPDEINDIRAVFDSTKLVLQALRPEMVIEGQAAGFDLLVARAAYELEIPFTAVRPWAGHRNSIPDGLWKNHWDKAWEYAEVRVTINPSETFPHKGVYFQRNEYMVDHADEVLALWTGKESGGTYGCIQYAKTKNKPLMVIDPNRLPDFTYPKDVFQFEPVYSIAERQVPPTLR